MAGERELKRPLVCVGLRRSRARVIHRRARVEAPFGNSGKKKERKRAEHVSYTGGAPVSEGGGGGRGEVEAAAGRHSRAGGSGWGKGVLAEQEATETLPKSYQEATKKLLAAWCRRLGGCSVLSSKGGGGGRGAAGAAVWRWSHTGGLLARAGHEATHPPVTRTRVTCTCTHTRVAYTPEPQVQPRHVAPWRRRQRRCQRHQAPTTCGNTQRICTLDVHRCNVCVVKLHLLCVCERPAPLRACRRSPPAPPATAAALSGRSTKNGSATCQHTGVHGECLTNVHMCLCACACQGMRSREPQQQQQQQ